MKRSYLALSTSLLALLATACGESDRSTSTGDGEPPSESAAESGMAAEDDEHVEEPLGTAAIGDLQVELAQGHGGVAAGKESHLVVKLPYSDDGATIVRAWIGTEDRTRSLVGKGEYAASHDDYDVHATAPDPLPADAAWWVEVEPPDGRRVVGSAPFLTK